MCGHALGVANACMQLLCVEELMQEEGTLIMDNLASEDPMVLFVKS